MRFGERLRVVEEIADACEDCAVPALLLQPLVENAVKHGIAGLVEGGSIRLAVERSGGGGVDHGGKRLRSGHAAPREAWGWGCRTSAAGWKCATASRPASTPAPYGRSLPRGAAVPLRIAHRLQQPGVAGAAHRQARAVGQNRDAALLAVRLDARHALQVDDGGAVNAHEARRVEQRLPATAMGCCFR